MKKLTLPFFLISTIVMIGIMVKTGAILKTPEAPMGIFNLEFAYNTTKTTPIINSWASINHTDVITAAKVNTYWDFVFLFFYSGFLFLASKRIAQIKNNKTGILFAKGALVAGFLDIGENIGMLATLYYQSTNLIAPLTTILATIKWLLALTAVVYILWNVIKIGLTKKSKTLSV